MSKLLDFIVIGAPKAGTTSLFHYLKDHPQIVLPVDKEQPFFSNDKHFHAGWEQFASEVFGSAPIEKIWGKVSPQYMTYPIVPERMHRTMPNVKLIALLRNPIDRAVSHHRMNVARQTENRTMVEVLSYQNHNPEATTYLLCGEYGKILTRYRDYFPADQLLVHFTEEFETNPQFVIDSILTFIGLSPGFVSRNLGERYNVGGEKQRFPSLLAFVRKIHPLRWLWKAIPKEKRRQLLYWYRFRMNTIPESVSPISPADRMNLVDFYRADVVRLEQLLGQKVPWIEFQSSAQPV